MTDLTELGWTPELARDFAGHRAKGAMPGRIRTQNREYYFAFTPLGELPAQLPGRLRRRGELPVVGDWVALRPPDQGAGMAMIEALLPRRAALSRAGTDPSRAQVVAERRIIAANIDLVLIVAAADTGPDPRHLERFLAAARASGAEPGIVLTKSDLVENALSLAAGLAAALPDVPVYQVSNRTGEGLATLRAAIRPGRTAVLIGSSGVGKSSLVNHFRKSAEQATAATDAQGQGRHTTTSRDLFMLEGGGLLMDTPGVRDITPWEEAGAGSAFEDIEALAASCRFSDCRHEAEPGCAVRAEIDAGRLDPERLEAYRKLTRETAALTRKGGRRPAPRRRGRDRPE